MLIGNTNFILTRLLRMTLNGVILLSLYNMPKTPVGVMYIVNALQFGQCYNETLFFVSFFYKHYIINK